MDNIPQHPHEPGTGWSLADSIITDLPPIPYYIFLFLLALVIAGVAKYYWTRR